MPVTVSKNTHCSSVNVSEGTDKPTNLNPVQCPAVNSEIVVFDEKGGSVRELDFCVPHEDFSLSEDDLSYFTWDVNHSKNILIIA